MEKGEGKVGYHIGNQSSHHNCSPGGLGLQREGVGMHDVYRPAWSAPRTLNGHEHFLDQWVKDATILSVGCSISC